MKPLLIIQLRPEDETADNEFEAFLKYGELEPNDVTRIRAEQDGLPEIDLNNYAGIVVGGSPFDFSTPEDKKSALQKQLEQEFDQLLKEVIAKDFPFLGACSGIGLLGKTCGATISSKFKEPVGGVDITLTPAGERDPLLKGFPTTFRALVGHKEACESVPDNAVLLATSGTCPVQMFRVKTNVYATQFHPEADAQGFTVRINVYKHHGYFSPHEAEDLIKQVEQEETPTPHQILKRFVARYQV